MRLLDPEFLLLPVNLMGCEAWADVQTKLLDDRGEEWGGRVEGGESKVEIGQAGQQRLELWKEFGLGNNERSGSAE